MSEENQNDNASNEAPQLSPAEEQARAQGWVPKEEFDGDEHRWVDAGEFLRRGELFEKIGHQSKKIKELEDAIGHFKGHTKKVEEAAYKRALEELRAQKKEALIEGDADKVIEIDEKIDEVRETRAQSQENPQPQAQAEHPVFTYWKTRNGWYERHADMHSWADTRGMQLREQGADPMTVLNTLEKEVKEKFSNRFENPNRSKAANVEGGSGRQGASPKSKYSPTADEVSIAKRFVRTGLYKNEQEYYDELAKMSS